MRPLASLRRKVSFSEKSDIRKSISLGSSADFSNLLQQPPKNIPPSCLDDILKKIDKDGYKTINKNQSNGKQQFRKRNRKFNFSKQNYD
jgi:hypothetical protein